MSMVRVVMSMSGASAKQFRAALPDLFVEFQQSPWIAGLRTEWVAKGHKLLITVHYEDNDPNAYPPEDLNNAWNRIRACLHPTEAGE